MLLLSSRAAITTAVLLSAAERRRWARNAPGPLVYFLYISQLILTGIKVSSAFLNVTVRLCVDARRGITADGGKEEIREEEIHRKPGMPPVPSSMLAERHYSKQRTRQTVWFLVFKEALSSSKKMARYLHVTNLGLLPLDAGRG